MDALNVPGQLKGPWDSLLILTFGAQLDFYENALVRQLADRCRNRVILCDATMYREICERVAEHAGQVRTMNQRYLVSGIQGPRGVAHAKCILLLNREEGRMLVGSGNLSLGGYARNQELFTLWHFTPEEPRNRREFIAVRQLVERLADLAWFQPEAAHQIQAMWEGAPWIRAQLDESPSVRHNIDVPLLSQFVSAVGDERVHELHVLAAFYDEKVAALRRALALLNPDLCRVYLQPNQTSVDPDALRAVLDNWEGKSQLILYSSEGAGRGDPYCHAKLLLARTATRSLCLQGSPNLSQVALLRVASQGNLEMANLLTGSPTDFDYIWTGLRLNEPTTHLLDAGLSYRSSPEVEPTDERSAWHLRAAALDGLELTLYCSGPMASEAAACLLVGDKRFVCPVVSHVGHTLRVTVGEELRAILESPSALRVEWSDKTGGLGESNPIVACNIERLNQTINAKIVSHAARTFGTLDINDDDIERLISEMSAGLLLDKADAFRVAGDRRPRPECGDEGATDRDLIDWEAIRSSSHYKQYLSGGSLATLRGGSLLSALLGSINAQFSGLTTRPAGATHVAEEEKEPPDIQEPSLEGPSVQDIAELEAAELAKLLEQRREQEARRLWQLLRNFVKRFEAGTFDPGFASQMGLSVVMRNYRVIIHLLALLLDRSQVRPEFEAGFLIGAIDNAITRFWGEYLPTLHEQEASEAAGLLAQDTVVPGSLLALVMAARSARGLAEDELHQSTRRTVHAILSSDSFAPGERTQVELEQALGAVARYTLISPSDCAPILRDAADWTNTRETLDTVAAATESSPGSLWFEHVPIMRNAAPRPTWCLFIEGRGGAWGVHRLVPGLAEWMRARPLDFYRMAVGQSDSGSWHTDSVLMYDPAEPDQSFYYDFSSKTESPVGPVTKAKRWWDKPLSDLFSGRDTAPGTS
ncbi:MAG: hypothetical protein M5U22_20620 [Thermoleophilia bacterium]|nr:hypothetical protein [Thermoleophilia bacterium]